MILFGLMRFYKITGDIMHYDISSYLPQKPIIACPLLLKNMEDFKSESIFFFNGKMVLKKENAIANVPLYSNCLILKECVRHVVSDIS